MYKKLLAAALLLCLSTLLGAQKRNSTYEAYIRQYSSMAIDQMKRHRIPASITLAQGLLESAAGQSDLARRANNHFGIKVGGDWTGPYIVKSDDRPDDRFRKYKSVKDSYEDHSLFLEKKRYARLFTYSIHDYKSWSHGLKACGYATSPTYANNLINIIELYDLTRFDKGRGSSAFDIESVPLDPAIVKDYPQLARRALKHPDFFESHPVAENNDNYYVRVKQGDNLKAIARATGVKSRKLRKYNELPRHTQPEPGSIIYLKKKCRRADRAFRRHPHTVQPGQSVYDIAQMYGMRVKTLYKLNNLSQDYIPQVGDQLRVR